MPNTETSTTILPLDAALATGSARFGANHIQTLTSDQPAARRLRAKFTDIFADLPAVQVGEKGIQHDSSGASFIELSLGGQSFLAGCLHAPASRLDPSVPLDIVTGCCLFGTESVVGHSGNMQYPLTDPPAFRGIVGPIDSLTIDEHMHVYEAETTARLGSFMSALANMLGDTPVNLTVHLPVPEYEIYGLHLYATGRLTKVAFETYRTAIRTRGKFMAEHLKSALHGSNISLTFTSPLEWLNDLDMPEVAPEHITQELFSKVRAHDPLWNKLISNEPNQSLIALNYASYVYQYLTCAKQAGASSHQFAFIENPEELPIYLHALKAQARTGVSISKALGFYVHPECVVTDMAFGHDEYLLYNAKNGCDPSNIEIAMQPYAHESQP